MQKISPSFLKLALLIEKYVFSALFLYLAVDHLRDIFYVNLLQDYLTKQGTPMPRSVIIILQHCLLIIFNTVIGVTLLFNKKAEVEPTSYQQIVVPFLATFFAMSFNAGPSLPAFFQINLLPPNIQAIALGIGTASILLGYSLSLWATITLGRSFAIYVSVRKIVSSGPYRYMRHPIYSGYVLEWFGLVLASFSFGSFLVFFVSVAVMVYRARLEEYSLAKADNGYRSRMQHTGFLFPNFKSLPRG